ncbi:MAG: two-component sensor histidine kinase, partial [Myxococcales bacterium]
MRLYQKLVLFMLAATLLPLSAVGFSLLSNAEAELKARIGAQQAASAASFAQLAGRELNGALELLVRSAEPFRWRELTENERQGAL